MVTDRKTDTISHRSIQLEIRQDALPFKDTECGSRGASISDIDSFTSWTDMYKQPLESQKVARY